MTGFIGRPELAGASGSVSLRPLRSSDFRELATLASRIWRAHYPGIISHSQIDYMLAARFSDAALQLYLDSDQRWFDVLARGDTLVGYCSHALGDTPVELKLEQLYLAPEQQRQGLGGLMLDHVEARARALGRDTLSLTVNKANARALELYRARGFRVRAELRIDIGAGYVMDDYLMAKPV